jgi:hypothetical protein
VPPAPLIEHWNGRSRSLRPTRALTRLRSALPYTVTCVTAIAPGDVWVLGTPGSNSSDVYLHWNGASWTLFRGPPVLQQREHLPRGRQAFTNRAHLVIGGADESDQPVPAVTGRRRDPRLADLLERSAR